MTCPHCGAPLDYNTHPDGNTVAVEGAECDNRECPSIDPLVLAEGEDERGEFAFFDLHPAPLANKGPFHEAWDREEDQLKIDDEQGYLERDDPIGPDLDQFDECEYQSPEEVEAFYEGP